MLWSLGVWCVFVCVCVCVFTWRCHLPCWVRRHRSPVRGVWGCAGPFLTLFVNAASWVLLSNLQKAWDSRQEMISGRIHKSPTVRTAVWCLVGADSNLSRFDYVGYAVGLPPPQALCGTPATDCQALNPYAPSCQTNKTKNLSIRGGTYTR